MTPLELLESIANELSGIRWEDLTQAEHVICLKLIKHGYCEWDDNLVHHEGKCPTENRKLKWKGTETMSDLKIKDIHDAITNGISDMPGQEYWEALDYGSPEWNEWIIYAQQNGIAETIRVLGVDA